MFKRSDVYWVKIGRQSFATSQPFFDYYKNMNFIDEYCKLDYENDYKWITAEKHYNYEGGLTIAYSERFFKISGLDKCLEKPEVY